MSAQFHVLEREIKAHAYVFAFNRNQLGQAIMEAAAKDILRAMKLQGDPDAIPWARLTPLYKAWKQKHYPGQPISVLLGHMRTLAQLLGEQWIQRDEMRQTYGVDALAKDLATWFQEGDTHQKPRPFYFFGPIGEARIGRVLDARFRQAFP
jgi:hypothetical protein